MLEKLPYYAPKLLHILKVPTLQEQGNPFVHHPHPHTSLRFCCKRRDRIHSNRQQTRMCKVAQSMLFTSEKDNIYNSYDSKEIITMLCSQETVNKTNEGEVPRQGVEVFVT